MFRSVLVCVMAALSVVLMAGGAEATEWFVAPGGVGSGTSSAPFGQISAALSAARPGDIITVRRGTYQERIATVRNGASNARIRLRAASGRGSVLVRMSGRVLTVNHAYMSVEGFVLDGQYGLDDAVRVSGAGDFFHLINSEVRRSTRDLIDISNGAQGVLIDKCLVHHALNAANGRTDAHGVVGGAIRDLTIRDTEIHTFSGDGIQVDSGPTAGWTGLTIERAKIWLAPLPAAANGFPAGTVPGENALDTKASASYPRAVVVVRDTTAYGFGGSLITNAAAFNLKEHIDATVERVVVRNSEIAFRLRGATTGGAWVAIKNAVVHDTLTAFRYEENIQKLRIWNSTVGGGVTRSFRAANSGSGGLDVRNLLVLGTRPAEAGGPSNLAVGSQAFVNAAADDYSLAATSTAIDAGVTIAGVTDDVTGVSRPQGAAYDIGAYEYEFGAPNSLPSAQLVSPTESATFVAPAGITLIATASDSDGSISDVVFYANATLIGLIQAALTASSRRIRRPATTR